MFETVYNMLPQRKMEMLAKGQSKVSAKFDLKVPAKKVLSASANCYLTGCEQADAEFRVSGKIVTRVIYIDEFDSFNSEEHTDNFTEKMMVKNFAAVSSVSPSAMVLEATLGEHSGTLAEVDCIIDIILTGIIGKEVRYASGITGDAETKCEKVMISTFSKSIEDKFSADDKFDLDKNCAGVLGVDCTAYLRDIDCNEDRIMIKGSVCANVIAVKNGEVSTMYNTPYEFDFNKTINCQGIGIEDSVMGNISIANISVKAENKTKPELSIEVDLVFNGHAVAAQEVEHVADAICFDNNLQFTSTSVEHTAVLPQNNTVVDVESNMTMPGSSPYIAKILTVSGANINSVNIVAADGKVTIEGVLAATVVYECEEKQIHTHEAQVPFTAMTRIDGVSASHGIQAAVQPITCHIKARRGKELLVDAKLGISVCAVSTSSQLITGDIVLGEPKVRDDSAIMIYMAHDKETLWDVAKRINMSSAEIIKQNPNCANGVSAGDKVFIYRQQVINF